MMRIYKLINPLNQQVFYVGATKLSLYQRLCAHISKARLYTKKQGLYGHNSLSFKKHSLIADILAKGLRPKIELIEIVEEPQAAIREQFHYDYYSSKGFVLLQAAKGMFYGENTKAAKS